MKPGNTHESIRHAPSCGGWRHHDCGDSTCGQEKERCPGCAVSPPALTVREAARRRIALDGADAQALEGALSSAEREIERLKAEINARKGDPVTRLHNLAHGLEQPLPCGHDLVEWCDNCETCGSCRDAARSAS